MKNDKWTYQDSSSVCETDITNDTRSSKSGAIKKGSFKKFTKKSSNNNIIIDI